MLPLSLLRTAQNHPMALGLCEREKIFAFPSKFDEHIQISIKKYSVLLNLVELKNGETYNGHLVSCDNWMNINLREVICTSRDGDKFWRMPECYIRGSTIKYLRIPDEVIDMVKEEAVLKSRGRGELKGRGSTSQRGGRGGGRGQFGGRGRPAVGRNPNTLVRNPQNKAKSRAP